MYLQKVYLRFSFSNLNKIKFKCMNFDMITSKKYNKKKNYAI